MTDYKPGDAIDGANRERFLAVAGIELHARLGQGSQAWVYRATWRGRTVAVKVLRNEASPTGAGLEALRRFRRETTTLARIHHRGLPEVLDSGVVDGRSYLVMEFVDGRSLADVIAAAPLAEAQVMQMARVLAEALQEVHSRDLVHRDLKPQNILVRPSGDVALVDFGLAGHTSAIGERVAGTLRYAAPEQTGMLKRPVDARADLYGLGAVMFEALTGRPPFDTTDPAELVRLHAVATPPAPSSLRKGISRAVDAVILKLLAKDPDDRYRSAAGLARDLARVRAGLASAERVGLDADHEASRDDGPLVGARAELESLRDALLAARRGQGSVVVLRGAAGVGKSRLVREWVRTEPLGEVTVLSGAASLDTPQPFAALRGAIDRWLSGIVGDSEAEDEVRTIAGTSAPLLKRLSPRLAHLFAVWPDLPSDVQLQEGYLEAVVDLVIGLARAHAPMVLLLDQAQAFDARTRQVLKRLHARRDRTPLVVVCLERTGGDAASARPVAPVAPVSDEDAQVLTLGPLDEAGLTALVGNYLGTDAPPAELLRHLTVRSAGNPLATKEYLRAMLDSGALAPAEGGWRYAPTHAGAALHLPGSLLELLALRVAQLEPFACDVLARAALIGPAFPDALLAQVIDAADGGAQALAAAREARVIDRAGPGVHEFVHDHVRAALVATLDDDVRARVHARLAGVLEAALTEPRTSTGMSGVVAEDPRFALADHYANAGSYADAPRAFAACEAAARAALIGYGLEPAYGYCQRAVLIARRGGLTPGPEFALLFGDACASLGKIDEAMQHFDLGLAQAQTPEARAQLHLARTQVFLGQLDSPGARAEAGRAGAALAIRLKPARPLALLGTLVRWRWHKFINRFRRPLAGAARARALLEVKIHERAARAAFFGVDPVGLLIHCFESSRVLQRFGSSPEVAYNKSLMSIVAGALVKPRIAERLFVDARRMSDAERDPVLTARVRLNIAHGRHGLGQSVEAAAAADECLDSFGHFIENYEYLTGCADLAWNYLIRGYAREGLAWVERGIARTSLSPGQSGLSEGHTFRVYAGSLCAILGDQARARAQLDDFRALIEAHRSDRWRWAQCLAHSALYHVETGDLGPAFEQVITEFRAIGFAPRATPLQLRHFFLAVAYARLTQYRLARGPARQAARRALDQAMAELGRLRGHPAVDAHVWLLRASVLRQDGARDEAARARATAERLAEQNDNVWVAYEVACERARDLRTQGLHGAAQRATLVADDLAATHGWTARRRRWRLEMGLDGSYAEPTHGRGLAAPSSAEHVHLKRHLAALLELSLASSRMLDPVAQARLVLDELVRILGAERGFLLLAPAPGEALRLAAARGADGVDLPADSPYSRTLVAQVERVRRPLVMSATEAGEAITSGSIVAQGLRSAVAAPLIVREHLLGVVCLDSRLARGVFGESDVEILLALANHIAVAIETARTVSLEAALANERDRRQLAEQLRAFGAAMTASLDLDEVLRAMLRSLGDLISHDRAVVLLPAGEGVRLVHAAAEDRVPEDGPGLPAHEEATPMSPGVAAALARDVPMASTDGAAHYLGATDARAWLTVPLQSAGAILGAIGLDRRRRTAFSAADLEIAGIIASQAAIAVANAARYGQVEWRATTDALTGVWGRGHVFLLAEQEMKHARRAGNAVAVLMIDVDHFKAINDQRGHQTGDEVLRELARRIRAGLRDVDLVGRYGGEEFCVILPETAEPGARMVAERVRAAIAATPFEVPGGPLAVTVSVGLACAEGSAADFKELVGQADRALYRAKAEGRNRVV